MLILLLVHFLLTFLRVYAIFSWPLGMVLNSFGGVFGGVLGRYFEVFGEYLVAIGDGF